MGSMSRKQQVLGVIAEVYEQAKNSRLSASFMANQEQHLALLANFFGVSPKQALLTATLFGLNQEKRVVGYNDFARYFDINSIRVFEFYEDFETLYAQGIIRRKKPRYDMESNATNHEFLVDSKVQEAILSGNPIVKSESIKHEDFYSFLSEFEELIGQRATDEICTGELVVLTEELMGNSAHLPVVSMIQSYKFSNKNLCIFLYILLLHVSGDDRPMLASVLETIIDHSGIRFKAMQKLVSKEDKLTRDEFIVIEKADFPQSTGVRLTDQTLASLKEAGLNIFISPSQSDNVVLPSSIFHKSLFFSPAEQKQIDTIKGLLVEEEFGKIQERLKERGLPIGVNILLHGAPGTGKTETVLQLARATNRKLMKVEISESKSMWFGESERKIKRIFTDYKSFAADCQQTPILLFNEADAIISKRKPVGSSNTAQVENSLQNILLEEMEGFEGILIATTNFVENMDAAFERRFLFKVKFERPSSGVRSKIWQEKLPNLSCQECGILANRFHFSGGQIDNIVRKKEIHEIVNGEAVSLDLLIEFCQQESWAVNPNKIGFSV